MNSFLVTFSQHFPIALAYLFAFQYQVDLNLMQHPTSLTIFYHLNNPS